MNKKEGNFQDGFCFGVVTIVSASAAAIVLGWILIATNTQSHLNDFSRCLQWARSEDGSKVGADRLLDYCRSVYKH